jgi:eukaryotic-like serine/threonine-protein kinase
MISIPAEQWATVSSLLDEALDLSADSRPDWLARLIDREPQLGGVVRQLLEAHAQRETADILATLPRIDLSAQSEQPAIGLAAGDQVGPYRLKRELGSGGMADVWLAERADGAFARDVALKLPRISRLRRELAARFARERDILARLEHPHIARLYDAGVAADGLPYLAMEYVDGQPITAWCDAKQLDIAARLRLFRQVLEAVQYAHANLVIHRDLKPSNILVTADGQVRLLDFGIAKLLVGDDDSAAETQLTQLGGRALTPDYASPEQIKGEALTIASDIYSLGVVLYELLAGQRPYQLKLRSAAQLELAILEAEAVAPSTNLAEGAPAARGVTARQLARALAGDLDTIVLRALEKAATNRYPTIAALAEDLKRFDEGRPVTAAPRSRWYRAAKFVVRNRIPVAAASAVLVALIAGLSVSLWQARAARIQAQRATDVKDFVVSIFKSADPYQGASVDTKAVDVLRQASERLAQSNLKDPETRIELMYSIGASLRELGGHQQAFAILREAADLAAVHLGELHPRWGRIQLQLGGAANEIGENETSERSYDAAERAMRRLGDMEGLSRALYGQSAGSVKRGNHDRAIDLLNQSIGAAQIHARGGDKEALIDSYYSLAERLLRAHRPGMLEPARRAFDLAQEFYGDKETSRTLQIRGMYATALVRDGDALLGITMLGEIATKTEAMLGPRHPKVAEAHSAIGRAAYTSGDAQGAIAPARRARDILAEFSGDKPTDDYAWGVYNVAVVLMYARQYEAALSEYARAEPMFVAMGGAGAQGLRATRGSTAVTLIRLGRLAQAEAILTEQLADPGASARTRAVAKGRLGNLRVAQQRYGEAYELLRESLAHMADSGTSRFRAESLSDLGNALVEGGRFDESIGVLQEALGLFRASHRKGSPDIADVLVGLARAHLALNNPQAALTSATEAAEYWQRVDPSSASAGIALIWWARALAATGDAAKAQSTLRDGVAILKPTALPPDKPLLAQAQRELRPRATR